MAAYPSYDPVHWFVHAGNPQPMHSFGPSGVRPGFHLPDMNSMPAGGAPPTPSPGHPYPLPHWTQVYQQLQQLPYPPRGY